MGQKLKIWVHFYFSNILLRKLNFCLTFNLLNEAKAKKTKEKFIAPQFWSLQQNVSHYLFSLFLVFPLFFLSLSLSLFLSLSLSLSPSLSYSLFQFLSSLFSLSVLYYLSLSLICFLISIYVPLSLSHILSFSVLSSLSTSSLLLSLLRICDSPLGQMSRSHHHIY